MWDLKCLGEDVSFKGIQKPGNRYYLCLSCSFQDLCCVLQSVQTKPVWMCVSSADFDVKTWCLHAQVKHTSKHERFFCLSLGIIACVFVCMCVSEWESWRTLICPGGVGESFCALSTSRAAALSGESIGCPQLSTTYTGQGHNRCCPLQHSSSWVCHRLCHLSVTAV